MRAQTTGQKNNEYHAMMRAHTAEHDITWHIIYRLMFDLKKLTDANIVDSILFMNKQNNMRLFSSKSE